MTNSNEGAEKATPENEKVRVRNPKE